MTDVPDPDDTIAALASAPGPAERGIVRISGPAVRDVLSRLFTPQDTRRWKSAKLPWRHPGTVTLPGLGVPLEVDILLWPTRRSYTGQPLAEVHTVGSPPLLEALLAAMFEAGARPAGRGEFTLRAFLAGRIDLLQAEAVLGVIDASDQQQLHQALGQLGGGLSQRIGALHEELLLQLADLEAGLDFVEEDIEFVSRSELLRRLAQGIVLIDELLGQSSARMQSIGRRRVVLAGLPNAGKSTLFNGLVGEERALVSEVPGTTRDWLSAPLDCGGLTVELIDTAGWDRSATGIARSADSLRQQQWEQADLILWCTACDLPAGEHQTDVARRGFAASSGLPVQPVMTKADLATSCEIRCGSGKATSHTPSEELGTRDGMFVSAASGNGLDLLKSAIRGRLQAASARDGLLGSTSARCRDSLAGAAAALARAHEAAAAGAGEELIAVELREGIDHLGKVAGRVYTDDILDRIFSRFCIGK